MKKAFLGSLSLLAAALALTGCLDVHQSLRLERDLSGKADFTLGINMEPMIYFIAMFQRQMEGKQGEPTAAELDKQRADFLASAKAKKSNDDESFEKQRPEIEKSLPPGVRLLDGSVDDQGLKIRAHLLFGFDDVAKLAAIQLPGKGGATPGPGPGNPYDQPFAGLRVVDEGKTLLLTMESTDPKAKIEQQVGKEAGTPPELGKMIEQALKDAKVSFQLDTPLTVLESNATRRAGNTLIWEYSLATIAKQGPPKTIRVRLQK